ncbi:AraC family transcriptional regulator [Euzebya tangerina]|uniref:AraC family transcriptional regulator n=1 Tax=Euzebya tangerina TaxID=591198 RepID=UPI000E31F093|nr:AraC family transcriptional regulator [Euzebya tangerina]
MDAVEALLAGPRARGAHLLRALMATPWAIGVRDRAPLTVVALVTGTACVQAEDGTTYPLTSGDVALVRGPEPYVVADKPGRLPTVVVHPGNRCESLDGRPLEESMRLGVRTWGHGLDASTEMLIGTYVGEGAVSRRLLDWLPPVVVQTADARSAGLVQLLRRETSTEAPGQATVLDRLLDVLVMQTVRWALDVAGPRAPGWFTGSQDPVVAAALQAIHDHPEQSWTVAALAGEAGVSRASLAKRFSDTVGESPIQYLTGWRMDLAADLLAADPALTIEAVARRVGYAGAFGFSSAFTRTRGVSPSAHRRLATV